MNSLRALLWSLLVFASAPLYADALEKARAFYEKGDYRAAIIEAKNALQQAPGNVQARLLLGEAYLALYKGAEAEKEFLRARQLGAEPAQWMIGLARAYFYQGKNEELLEALPLDESLDPDTYAALAAWRAAAQIALGDVKAAQRTIEAGMAKNPDEPELMLSRARMLLGQRDLEGAKALLEALLERRPDDPEAHAMLGAIAKELGDEAAARRHYQAAVEANPYNISAYIGLATLAMSKREFDEARRHLAKVSELVPGHLYGNYLIALLALDEGKMDEAERRIDFVLQNAPDFKPAIFVKGTILLNKGQYEQADRYLSLYLQSVPDNWLVAEWLAFAKNRIGDYEGALEVLRKYGNRERANYYVLSGVAQMGLKAFDEASKSFEKALSMAPDSDLIQRQLAVARMELGDLSMAEDLFEKHQEMGEVLFIAHMNKGEHARAAQVARSLVEKDPDNPVYRNMLGLALLGQGKVDEAIEALQAAVKAKPDYLTARYNLARAYDLQGRLDEAEREYREANRIKRSAGGLVGLANVAMKRGNLEEAERLLEKAVELDDGATRFLARFYLQTGRADEAIAVLKRSDDPGAWRLLVQAYLGERKLDEALAVAERMAGETPADRFLLGRLYFAKGDRDAAARAYRAALEARPDYLPALVELARLAVVQQDAKAFRKYMKRIEALEGTAPVVAELKGDWALSQDDGRAAMDHYRVVIEKYRPSRHLWRKFDLAARKAEALDAAEQVYAAYLKRHENDLWVRRRYALLLQTMERPEAAAAEYERVLAQVKDDPVTLNNLAWLYIESGDKRALELSRRAMELTPDNPGVVDTHAWALIRFGEPEKGVVLLKEWVAKLDEGPQLDEMKYHLAYGLLQSGRSEEAQRYIEELERRGAKEWVSRLKALQGRLGGHRLGASPCCA